MDTNPPTGWATERHILRSDFGLTALVSYDLSSLFAGKLHALCFRAYTKGRDWYDLAWYMTRRPFVEPNLGLLSNAVEQTEGDGGWNADAWRSHLLSRIEQLDPDEVSRDIAPFIERKEELDLFSKKALEGLVRGIAF